MKKALIINKLVSLFILLFIAAVYSLAQDHDSYGFRKYLMLNPGDSATVILYDGTIAKIMLLEVDYEKDKVRGAIREAKLRLSVDGEEKWIIAGNYHVPEAFTKVKIDCPITREYESNGYFPEGAWRLTKEVKLRVWPLDKPLCPEGFFTYPINQKWFATNTTHELEPVEIDHDNLKPHSNDPIYYHWGEDIAGVKGITEVLAAGDGIVIAVGENHADERFFREIKGVQPRFDRVFVKMGNGWVYRYSHLQSFSVTLGQKVAGGDEIGKLGNRWSDFAHMHFEMWSVDEHGDYILEAAYPYFRESYIHLHHPAILADARPHQFITVGDEASLDGTKSESFAGKIVKWKWIFHDGAEADGPTVKKRYYKPGYFSEILQVEDDKGNIEYDYVHVLVVYDHQPDMRYGYTSVSYHPSFNIHAGQKLTFKGRFFNIDEGEDHWDFGDGSPVQVTHSDPDGFSEKGYATLQHIYKHPGHYFVTFSRTVDDGTTSTSHLSILVEDADTVVESVSGSAD